MLPKTDESKESKTTAQKIKELSEQDSMNHRTMIAKAKHTDFMNPYSMSCGNKTSVKNHTGDYHPCCMVSGAKKPGSMNHRCMVAGAKHTGFNNQYCMVARAGKRNGNRARRMACQDKERVPPRDKELKTWDLNKTKVRIQVDRTKWQKRYPCRSRLVQRLRRHACQAVKGCKPEGQGIKKEERISVIRLRKTHKSLQSLRREEGESASSWEDKSNER